MFILATFIKQEGGDRSGVKSFHPAAAASFFSLLPFAHLLLRPHLYYTFYFITGDDNLVYSMFSIQIPSLRKDCKISCKYIIWMQNTRSTRT